MEADRFRPKNDCEIKDDTKTTREKILEQARKAVCGDRDKQYGSPEKSFASSEVIKNRRTELGLSREEMSKRTGKDAITIGEWERHIYAPKTLPRSIDKVKLGRNLREMREDHGYSQVYLSGLLGMKYSSSISNWEHGLNMPSISSLIKLCHIYRCDISDLFNEEDAKKITALLYFVEES